MTTVVLPGQLALDLDAEPKHEPEPEPPPLPAFVPSDRLRTIVQAYLDRTGMTRKELALRTGLNEGRVSAILRGEWEHTRFAVADRLVTYIDPWAWHRPPPHGLGDLYGSPLVTAISARTGPSTTTRLPCDLWCSR